MCPAHTLSGPSYSNPTAEEDNNSVKPSAKVNCSYLLFEPVLPEEIGGYAWRRGGVGGEFGALCTREAIRQELTTADTPKLNGAADPQIATIDAAGLAARIHAS